MCAAQPIHIIIRGHAMPGVGDVARSRLRSCLCLSLRLRLRIDAALESVRHSVGIEILALFQGIDKLILSIDQHGLDGVGVACPAHIAALDKVLHRREEVADYTTVGTGQPGTQRRGGRP